MRTRINNFIKGFLMGMGLGIIFFSLIFWTTGAGGRAPAPEKNSANTGRFDSASLPASSYRIADGCLPVVAIAKTGLVGGSPPAADQLYAFSQAISLDKQVGDVTSYVADQAFINHGFTQINTDWLNKLIDKIWQRESSGWLNPPDGDDGRAVGPLQIHQEALTDINQRFGLQFTIEDMRDIGKAKLVAKLYITMHLDNNLEEITSRIFHYGPAGWRGKDVDDYWEKIKNIR